MDANNIDPAARSDEEIAWDEEFKDTRDSDNDIVSTLGDLLKLAVRVPVAIVQMPMSLLPEETARHARASAREGFLAVRSLFSAMADGIEGLLAEPDGKQAASKGPAGTWGGGQSAWPSYKREDSLRASSEETGKLKRIQISDEQPDTSSADLDLGEGRGLRSDIDY